MSKGVLLFAFNNGTVDYYKMAVATAKRVNKFLSLPVSVVTDNNVEPENYNYTFDHVFIETADTSNNKGSNVWINKGRYKAFDITPYDETILLDTDYLVNSNKLLDIFNIYTDFMIPNHTRFLMIPEAEQELISELSYPTLWATLIAFKKTNKVKQIFECLEMVQKNYQHYSNLHHIPSTMYRNDYAVSIAHRIVHGQSENTTDYLPWPLTHVSKNIKVFRDTDTAYTLMREVNHKNKTKTEYMKVKDIDFHMLDKNQFMELVDE
jgi:hypothetical protein